jgi:2-keto-4-pentenoate hydratase
MDTRTVAELADRLIAAEESRTPIEVPSLEYVGMTVADGYAVQRAIIAKKVARGDRVIGKKVGLTSKANQDVFHVHEPVYGQQGHSVFEFNTDESSCLRRLGSQPAASRRYVGLARAP